MRKFGFLILIVICFGNIYAQGTSEKLEEVAEFDKSMGLGLSVTSDNRIFVSFPDFDADGKFALVEIKDKSHKLVYPNISWNTQAEKDNYENHFLRIQDIEVDGDDNLWVLDSQPASSGNIFGDGKGEDSGMFKLVKINTQTDEVEKVYLFEDLDKKNSALNDVRIDLDKNKAYLSDPGLAAVVVLDLETGKSRAVLKDTEYTVADDFPLQYDGKDMIDENGNPFSSDVNGIALTHDFEWFYFKPINDRNLYRIKTKYLADKSLTDNDLKGQVETIKDVGINHGMVSDKNGNIYLTTSEDYSVSYVDPEGNLHTLVQDSRLIWPDSLGIGSDGYLYFSATQIQQLPQWNKGEDKTDYPYRIYRTKLPK